jgi:hypothetical protein
MPAENLPGGSRGNGLATRQLPLQNEKRAPGGPEALGFPGGADRDRTDGLLNAIRNNAPEDLKFPKKDGYDDEASGD